MKNTQGSSPRRRGSGRLAWIPAFAGLTGPVIFLASSALAADLVSVHSRVWPKEVKMGDDFKLIINIDRPKNYKTAPLSPQIPIFPFELKKIDSKPLMVAGVGEVREEWILTLTVFELGDLEIPSISLHYTDAAGVPGQLQTQPIKIKVRGAAKKATDKDDIRPIKPPVHLNAQAFWNWVNGILAGVLLIILTVKVVLRRLKKRAEDLESLKPAHERAYLELERLRAENYLGQGKPKAFYNELADILRRYLERRYQIEALELTTAELFQNLKTHPIERPILEAARELLEKSDLVKFAKYDPPRLWSTQLPELLCRFVDSTKLEVRPKDVLR